MVGLIPPKSGGGEKLPYYETVSQDSGMLLQFYEHYFPDERKGIFRYLVVGYGGGDSSIPLCSVYMTLCISMST
jgi:hypothetical protein